MGRIGCSVVGLLVARSEASTRSVPRRGSLRRQPRRPPCAGTSCRSAPTSSPERCAPDLVSIGIDDKRRAELSRAAAMRLCNAFNLVDHTQLVATIGCSDRDEQFVSVLTMRREPPPSGQNGSARLAAGKLREHPESGRPAHLCAATFHGGHHQRQDYQCPGHSDRLPCSSRGHAEGVTAGLRRWVGRATVVNSVTPKLCGLCVPDEAHPRQPGHR